MKHLKHNDTIEFLTNPTIASTPIQSSPAYRPLTLEEKEDEERYLRWINRPQKPVGSGGIPMEQVLGGYNGRGSERRTSNFGE